MSAPPIRIASGDNVLSCKRRPLNTLIKTGKLFGDAEKIIGHDLAGVTADSRSAPWPGDVTATHWHRSPAPSRRALKMIGSSSAWQPPKRSQQAA